ncbi:GGDEF domain-containing protein [Roseiflexus sp.]|uniref:GGDEF domain-containing protein n=1 Tax=Roseiflexus sp. TaxID=2562120 RepID=UPI0021DD19F6|nr:GGDEF domain-containing protein [Roseiflexus sp.]GIW01809.1 MAG: GGDEF domain-containing protein [Roseiflexus sp.]
MMQHIEQERLRFEQQRRLIYRIAGVLGVLAILYAQCINFIDPSSSYAYRAIYALNHIAFAGVCIAVVWMLGRQHIPIDRIERLMLVIFIVQSLGFNGIVPAIFLPSPSAMLIDAIGDDIWFLLIICVLAVHLYDVRRGALIAASVFLVSFGIVMIQLARWRLIGVDAANSQQVISIYLMAGALLGFLIVLSAYRAQAERLRTGYELMIHMAYTDTLTGLPNRRRLYEELRRLIGMADRYGQEFCVCLFDIDHFKQLNDQHGHLVGDQVLCALAQTVPSHLRTVDHFGRWGGEEFAILLPQTSLSDAQMALDRVRMALQAINLADVPTITASFGVAEYLPGDTSESILHRADQSMYLAKTTGRNRIVVDGDVEAGLRYAHR